MHASILEKMTVGTRSNNYKVLRKNKFGMLKKQQKSHMARREHIWQRI